MTRADLLEFLRSQQYAVQASVASEGAPQAAVVGVAVSDDLEIVFDTLDSTRKVPNLRRSPRVAFVFGGTVPGDERTAQVEGVADEPRGAELRRLQEVYFARFPEGRARKELPGIVYVRARPTWIRYSDYNRDPPFVIEFSRRELRRQGR
jgi:general stress protein 26